jgi:2-keto-4-pentenoate hydratase
MQAQPEASPMPDQTRLNQAAATLLAVRHGAPPVVGLGAAAPRDEAEAWTIQREVLARRGGTIGGYKCAMPPQGNPSNALLDARGIIASPATWPVPPGGKIGIETEIAFRLGRALPPRGTPWTQAEVTEAIAACFPAVELVTSRYVDPMAVSPLEAMADNIAHAALVCGTEVPDWRARDLGDLTVRQSCDGEVQVEKRGASPAGDPLTSLTRLANHLHQFGLQLEAGQVVTTGSWTGLIWVTGGRVAGGFEGFGEVVVELG